MNFASKTPAEIEQFCKDKIAPEVWALKNAKFFPKMKIKRYLVSASIWGVPGAIGINVPKFATVEVPALQLIALLGLCAIIYAGFLLVKVLFFVQKAFHQQRMAYLALKQEIKKRTFEFLDHSFKYQESVKFPLELYLATGLPSNFDRSSAEDFCQGKIGATIFRLMEVSTAKKETYRDHQGHTQVRWISIFKGLLFAADFNKNFSAKTIIRSDQLEKHFGIFARTVQKMVKVGGHLKLVELENPVFEKLFKVESTDPNQARYLLSASFMEKLCHLHQHYPNLQIGFADSQIIIAIPYQKNFLDDVINLDQLTLSIQNLILEILSILSIVDELNLNTRIWSKKPELDQEKTG